MRHHLKSGHLWQALIRPIDIASIVFFRIAFGLLLLIDVGRYFANGWIDRYYIQPDYMFKYYGFGWIEPLPGDGMYWLFAALGVLALMITVGAAYRIATVLFLIGFTYVFLLDQSLYLNHFYLVILIGALLCFVPAHRALSIDSWMRPGLRSNHVPAWSLWVLLAQFEIVLIYAGLVKINPDWLQLEPLATWLARDSEVFLIGPLFEKRWAIAIGAYGVIALHVIGAPLLLWRRTRPYVFVLYLCFHALNHVVFEIGIFPWMTLAGTLLFFEPDWPRKLIRRGELFLSRVLERRHRLVPGAISSQLGSTVQIPAADAAAPRWQAATVYVLTGWLAVQALIPMRHYLYPGDVGWTEEGHRFAWRMKLRDKRGETYFRVTDTVNGIAWHVEPAAYLNRKQAYIMACRPDMILQFAHHLADQARAGGVAEPDVRALTSCSLNGRSRAPLVDPERNLASIRRSLAAADWLLPLTQPLPRPGDFTVAAP